MISIDQIINIVCLIILGTCILALLGVVVHMIIDDTKDLKELSDPKPKKRYWIIKYRVYAECYGSYCVKARSKAEALYKFHNNFEYAKNVIVEDVKEVHNE